MPFLRVTALTVFAFLLAGSVMAESDRVDVRNMVGARIVTSAEGDFIGPNRSAIVNCYQKLPANCVEITCRWSDVQKESPKSDFDWSAFDSDPLMKFSGVKIISINLACPWAADLIKEKNLDGYWLYAEKFVQELAKHCGERGINYFHITGSNFNRLNRTDWARFVVEPLQHLYPAIKSANRNCVVIGGNIYGGADEDVQALYRAGIKGYFDILEIHPYTNNSGLGVDISQIISAHHVLERNGDGDKQIFIGEGWGPDPVGNVANTGNDPDILRDYLINGYRNLCNQQNPGYDPSWVFGALFNSMNDYQVSQDYRNRVKKVDEDGDGKVDCTLIDGYRLPADADIDRTSFNCGLIDIKGKPKNDLVAFFGKSLKIEVYTGLNNASPIYMPGIQYKLAVEAYNAMEEPVDAPNLTLQSDNPAVVIDDDGSAMPTVLNGVTRIKKEYTVTFSEEVAGSRVNLSGKLTFKWKGNEYHIISPVEISVNRLLETSVLPANYILPNNKGFDIFFVNHSDKSVKFHISFNLPDGIRTSPIESSASIEAMGVESRAFTAGLLPGFKVGRSNARILADGKDVGGFNIDIPATAPKQAIKVDGDLGEWNSTPVAFGEDPKASVRFAYDDTALYIAVETEDSVHMQPYTGLEIWRGDSVRIAIDPLMNGPLTQYNGYRNDDHEFVFAIEDTKPVAERLFGTPGNAGLDQNGLKLDGGKAIYEIAVPWVELAPLKPENGKIFGISVLVNDIGSGVKQSQWGGGISGKKDPNEFYKVKLDQ